MFDDFIQSLSAIGKDIDADELIVLYANSLPVEMFSNWIQSQMAFINNLSITEFKWRFREEARRLTLSGRVAGLGVGKNDPDTVKANYTRSNNHQRLFPPRKVNNAPYNAFPPCGHCGYHNHSEQDCHKHIAEEYNAKQARKASQNNNNKRGSGGGRGRGSGGSRGGYNPQAANLANANANANGSAPAYNSIFDGLAYCCKAAVNSYIQKVKGVGIKDCI